VAALIAENRKAPFNYFIDERFEAGVVLEGWEVKAIRAGRCQMSEGYVVIRKGELFLIGAHIGALETAARFVKPDPVRSRKLMLHKEEIRRLIGKVEQRGFTLIPLNLHYKGGRVKADIALARGKKQHDKRDTESKRDWEREHAQIMRGKPK
jgi:SsrA-binding protein